MARNGALTFTSGGETVAIERFAAAGAYGGPRPAVILLHGADGLSFADQYRFGARTVASSGYHVFLPHYFDRTHERRASFATIERHFPAWMQALRDAVGFVARQADVDGERIGVIGASLGAGLALATAVEEPRIKAIVDYFGFLPPTVAARARRLPPTLILHGANDLLVPVANAYAIEALLRQAGVPYEIKVYDGEGHGFFGHAALDAAQRVSAFLARHLGGAQAVSPDAGLGLR